MWVTESRLVHPERTTRFYLIMAGSIAAVVILGAIVAASMLGNVGQDFASSDSDATAERGVLATDELAVSTPLVVYRGFDDAVPIILDSAAPPGSMLLVSGREIPVSDDRALLTAEAIDALPEGRHPLTLRTDAGDLPLRSELDVRTPPIALAPLAITEDATSQLVLTVGAPGLPTPANLTVLVEGEPVVLSDHGREHVFAVSPKDADVLDVQIGRLIQRDVRVLPELGLVATDDNGTLLLTVTDAEGSAEGVDVAFGKQTLGTTDANGTLRVPFPEDGERALRLVAPDGRVVERGYAVRERTLFPVPARFTLSAYGDPGAQTLAALVDVTNLGVANDTVTILARVDGTAIASARVDVAPGARAETRLVANVPLTAPVTIEAYGTRAAGVTLAYEPARDEDVAAGNAAAPPPVAPPGPTPAAAPATQNVSMRVESSPDAFAMKSTLAGRAPDATYTLYPTVVPTAASEHSAATPEPAVPGPGAALILLAIVVAAFAASRRRHR